MAREISFQKRRGGLVLVEQLRETFGRTPELAVLLAFLVVLVFFMITTGGQILDARSISSFVTNATSQGILAVGITVLMISGEFDLSVGSMLGLSALVFILAADGGLGRLLGMFFPDETLRAWGVSFQGFPGLLAIAISLATGALLGLFNGVLRIATRIPSFIVTLGTLYLYRSIMLAIIPGGTIARYLKPPILAQFSPWALIAMTAGVVLLFLYFTRKTIVSNWDKLRENEGASKVGPAIRLVLIGIVILVGIVLTLQEAGTYSAQMDTIVEADLFDVLNGQLPISLEHSANYRSSIIWWFVIAALFQIILTQTRYGNAVFAAGGNPDAARTQGVNVNRVKVYNFVLSGVLAAVGGIMEAARFRVVEPLRGTGYELDVIAAAVIGGTLLTGGYGSIIGALLGVLLAGMLKTGLVLIGVEASWFRGVLGVIMIVAVIINTNIRRQR